MPRLLRVWGAAILVVLALGPRAASAQDDPCVGRSREEITSDARQVRALIEQARALPPQQDLGNGVTAQQFIRQQTVVLEQFVDCLTAAAEPAPDPDEAPAVEAGAVPALDALDFLRYEGQDVCVLRGLPGQPFRCIDFEGNVYTRGESPPVAAPAGGGADAPSARPDVDLAQPFSFAGTWSGPFRGPLRAGAGCETTEQGTLTFRFDQAMPGDPVTGVASFMGNIAPRTCGAITLGGADVCANARIGPVAPIGNRLRFQLTCNNEAETVELELTGGTEAAGAKRGRSGLTSWDMTFELRRQ